MLGVAIFTLFLSWVQVSSDAYIVKSSAGEKRAQRVLKELEDFHQLIGSTLVFRNTELPELPIEVLVVGDEQTMEELEPEYNGRKVAVAGYYQAGPDRDFIVLSGQTRAELLTRVVYHELTHYFLTRGLASRPTWLSEGFGEYFSTAEFADDEVALGAVSPERLELLRSSPLLPLKQFFAVDSGSPYYNESSKANVFYAQAWAFIHFMMHGQYAPRFKQYLNALQSGDADLLQFLQIGERDLELGFSSYVKILLQRPFRDLAKITPAEWEMRSDPIPDSEAEISIAEIFLASGRLPEARRRIEALTAEAPDSTRVSYYRGILAQMTQDPNARDFFVDSLLDPFLAPRAAAQLVAMGDIYTPAVRTILEEAAAMHTRIPEVYLALAAIYSEDVRRIEENVRAARHAPSPAFPADAAKPDEEEGPEWHPYLSGKAYKVEYEILSSSDKRPSVHLVQAPYYPPELLEEGTAGKVVMDVEIGRDGKVAGVWLVSAEPELFSNLAAESVRQWEFEPIPAKVRVVVKFQP